MLDAPVNGVQELMDRIAVCRLAAARRSYHHLPKHNAAKSRRGFCLSLMILQIPLGSVYRLEILLIKQNFDLAESKLQEHKIAREASEEDHDHNTADRSPLFVTSD